MSATADGAANGAKASEEQVELKAIKQHDYASDSEDDEQELLHGGEESTRFLSRDDSRPARPSQRDRASTGSSFQFDIAGGLPIGASAATSDYDRAAGVSTKTQIGVIEGIALCVGIGSGIFASPGVIAREVGSLGTATMVWIGCGLLAYTGALSFTELVAAIPLNGGPQAFLNTAFGPLPSYMFSFCAITALKPGSQAIIAIVAGEYLARVLYGTAFSDNPDAAVEAVPQVVVKLIALLTIGLLAVAQWLSAKAAPRTQVFLTGFKVLAVILIFVGALVALVTGTSTSFTFNFTTASPQSFALAIFSAVWSYDGFDQLAYVAAEIDHRKLLLMVHSTMILVTLMYLLAVMSFFVVIPFDIASTSTTIGLEFGRQLFGSVGGLVMALAVFLSCVGAMNGSMFTSARLIVASSEQRFLPKRLARFNERGTPRDALIVCALSSAVFILVGDFARLSVFYGTCAYSYNLLTVIGLLWLRVKEPGLHRPYKVPLVMPIVFSCTALFLVLLSIASKPLEAFAAFIFIFMGAVPYYIQQRTRRTPPVVPSA